jgi:hypothetical protein
MAPVPQKIRIVCATRAGREEFSTRTALGRSLTIFRFPVVELKLFDNNTLGLPVLKWGS